jgi:hypothetical protein
MVEALKVVMMNQSSMEPVPIQYNSTILHILEAYYDLRMELQSRDESIEALKQSHTKDIRDFEDMTTGWHSKEKDYRAEVKRLEVLLSKTEGGMESMVLARSNSLIHGLKRASETIKQGIGTVKERNAAYSRRDPGLLPLLAGLAFRVNFLQISQETLWIPFQHGMMPRSQFRLPSKQLGRITEVKFTYCPRFEEQNN